jgi:hypothetical protein
MLYPTELRAQPEKRCFGSPSIVFRNLSLIQRRTAASWPRFFLRALDVISFPAQRLNLPATHHAD